MDNFENNFQQEQPTEEPAKKEEIQTEEPKKQQKDSSDSELTLSSKKNWFYVGLIIAILNPIFAGLIIGVFYLTEKDLRKEGRIILLVAIVFGFIHTYAVQKILPFIQPGMM